MSLLQLVREWFTQSGPEAWNPDEDDDVIELRRARAESEANTRDLRRWHTGNIVEMELNGVAGLIEQERRNGSR